MPVLFPRFSALSRLVLCVAALALPALLRAAEPPQLNQHTSEELEKLQPLTTASKWNEALALLDSIVPTVSPTSYDFAIISDIRSKIFMQKNEYAKAIEPMETAVRLGEANGYFEERDLSEKIHYLAQIYYQEAATSKNPDTQQKYFDKAALYIKRWISSPAARAANDNERQEAQLLYASILYNRAVVDPAKVDMNMLKQAEAEVQNGLLSSPHPKDTFYILLLASYQQQGNYLKAAEILEELVKQYPAKKDYWTQLIATYLNLALDKDEQKSRAFNIRAILTTERAQALGFAKTPKDNFNLVGIYINLGQYGKATELLYNGLKNGTIPPEQKNWEYLAYCYQQVDKPYQAIDVLKEAATHFPKSGQLDYQAAQIYYSLDKSEETYRSLVSALAKGNLEKPAAVYNFLAYIGFEMRKYDEALTAVNKAIELNDSKSETMLPRLKQAIEDAIKEREQAKLATPQAAAAPAKPAAPPAKTPATPPAPAAPAKKL